MSLESRIDDLQHRVRVASDISIAAHTKISFESDLPVDTIVDRLSELPSLNDLVKDGGGRHQIAENFRLFGQHIHAASEALVKRSAVIVPAMGHGASVRANYNMAINIVYVGNLYSSIQRLRLISLRQQSPFVLSSITTPAIRRPIGLKELDFKKSEPLDDYEAFNFLAVAEDMFERRIYRLHPK